MGIGINYDQIGKVNGATPNFIKLTQVRKPTDTVFFADAGAETGWTGGGGSGVSIPNWDNWGDYTGATANNGYGNVLFRENVTDDFANFQNGDANSIPRHNHRVNVAWGDGHVQTIKNSEISYSFGKGTNGAKWDVQ